MTYENAVEKIHSLLTFGSRPGLDRMRILLDRLGNPQDRLKFIHIAGTNGKGSVCAMLSSALVAAGYKTGLFISPYITDFRERIQINNCMVSESVLTDAVEKTFPIIEQLREEGTIITEFEYVNALQFYIHANADCDIVVLETGMGGLLDCTNTIKSPLCAVITTIGLDHTAILGDTIEKIAQQKCGIFKPDSMAVTSKQDIRAMKVIESTAREKKIPLATSESVNIDVIETTLKGSRFMFNGVEIDLPLSGDHQLENAKTAQYAVISTIDVETGELSKGLKAVLGGSAKIYCTKNYMYINEYIEGERYGEPERDVTSAMKLNFKNGKFTYASETEVKQYSNNTIDIGRGDMYDSFLYPFGEYYISLGHDANDFKDEIILFDKNMKELDSIIFENECVSVNTNLPRFDENTNTITLPANYYDEGIEDYHYQGTVVLEITNNKIEINDRIKDSTHIINIDYENYYYCPQIIYDDCIYSIYINNNAPDNKKLKVFSYKF